MFHKELIERMTKRIDGLSEKVVELTSQVEKLEGGTYIGYQCFSIKDALEQICNHLKLRFRYESPKEQRYVLESTLPPKKPKKKAKKKK